MHMFAELNRKFVLIMCGNSNKNYTDNDECATNNGGCSQGCNNTVGSFECTCTSGYELSDDGRTCIDIDECSTRMHNCQQVCVNTDGGFRCECDQGYQLNDDGTTCSGTLIIFCDIWLASYF